MGTKNSKEKVKKRNPGKIFETNWKMRSEKQGVFCLRLHDSDLSFNPFKDYRSKYTVENPCDFIHFHKGHLFALELKSTKYKSFSIQREESEDSKMIKLHQINSLVNFSLYDGVEAGIYPQLRNNLIPFPMEGPFGSLLLRFGTWILDPVGKKCQI